MKNSNIEWTDHTWNIAVGCTKVDADCKFCYMYRDSMNDTRYDPKTVRKTKTVFNLPLKIKEPSRIFTSSLTDFFHPDIDAYRHEAWDIIRRCPQHTFQILTKRPERIKAHLPEDWGDGWDNVWLGTSVGDSLGLERIESLIEVKAKIRFLSIEPLHGYIDLYWELRSESKCTFCEGSGDFISWGGGVMCPKCKYDYRNHMGPSPIDWVIVGGESGNEKGKYQYRPCKMSWIKMVIDACADRDVPIFVKQLGTHLSKELKLKDRHGKDMDEWPETLRVRQFPKESTVDSP
jgi:protein gp37